MTTTTTTTTLAWTKADGGHESRPGYAVFRVERTGGGRYRLLVDGVKTGADTGKQVDQFARAEAIAARTAAVEKATDELDAGRAFIRSGDVIDCDTGEVYLEDAALEVRPGWRTSYHAPADVGSPAFDRVPCETAAADVGGRRELDEEVLIDLTPEPGGHPTPLAEVTAVADETVIDEAPPVSPAGTVITAADEETVIELPAPQPVAAPAAVAGLTKPQARILAALYTAGGPLGRAAIVERAGVAASWVVGFTFKACKANKTLSLVEQGLAAVRYVEAVGKAAEITKAGRVLVEAAAAAPVRGA